SSSCSGNPFPQRSGTSRAVQRELCFGSCLEPVGPFYSSVPGTFGMRELLGLEQVRAWTENRPHASRLKTGLLYRWLRHPMYVGVLLGVWATPRMSCGHLLLALALTAYVLIAMRYEERDLLHRFGRRYADWRD